MAKYRKVDPRIWNDEKFQSLPPLDKLIAVYCLTAQANRIGIFKFSIALAAEDLGMKPAEVRERLERVSDTLSWPYDLTRRVLYFPNWWKYNSPGSSKTFIGILEDAHEVPQTPLLNEFASNTAHLTDSLSDTLCLFFGKGMPYQEQEQEQEQEQDLKEANASFCAEPERPAATLDPVFVFPVVGKDASEWPLTQDQIDQLQKFYPDLDVGDECRKAAAWCVANPARRKTPRGMPRFLNGWMERCQNRGGSNGTGHDKNKTTQVMEQLFGKDPK